MKRRDFLALLGGATGWALGAEAPQAGTIKRVGLLRVGPAPKEWIESFRQGLGDPGLVEGQGYSVELGLADRAAQIPEVLAQLVRRKVDVIVASGVPSVLPARDGAGTIPVVFIFSGDPVAMRLAASLARPGGNLTGVTVMDSAVTAKRFSCSRSCCLASPWPRSCYARKVLKTPGTSRKHGVPSETWDCRCKS